jgi:5-methylcytosine-specific restriction enzyme subunit McrC
METSRRLQLQQYKQSNPVQLPVSTRDGFSALIPDLVIAPVPGRVDEYTLTAGSYVGVAQLDDITVAISPKISIARLLFMLSYGLDRFRWQDWTEVDLKQAEDVVDVVALVLVRHIRHAVRRGLLHGYYPVEDTLPVVRGRIRVGEQITRRFGRFPPIEVEYDDFSYDVPENTLLRAALRSLSRMPLRAQVAMRAVREADSLLQDVAWVRYSPRTLPEVMYTRLNRHYRSAVELAKLVIRSTSHDIGHGFVTISAFLLNMDDVFEDFVYLALRDALGLSADTFVRRAARKGFVLDKAGAVRLEPDLSWWSGGHCLFVGDVKYKDLSKQTSAAKLPPSPDLYQLLAYVVAAGLDEGMLIYAAGPGDVMLSAQVHDVPAADIALQCVWLDLSRSPMDVLGQVAALAAAIKSPMPMSVLMSGSTAPLISGKPTISA